MAHFHYKCRDKFSKALSGTLVADSRDEAAKKLVEMGYVPVLINQTREITSKTIFARLKRVSLDELNFFTRQLYSLQKAGMTLLSSLNAISEETKNSNFKSVIDELSQDIKSGISFSNSLRKHNRIFDPIFINMIQAAEISGNLVEVLERLTLLIEQEIDTQNRIKQATRYPLIAFVVLCVGFLIIVTFVIPRFALIYGTHNALLPLPTRILIVTSNLIKQYLFILLAATGILSFVFIKFINSETGRPVWDGFKLKVPIFGPLINMLTMSRFSRITAILMKSGVPVLEVLDLSAATSGNLVISRAILNIKESVNQGKGLSAPMKVSGLFPSAVVQMVHSGEQVGRVEELLLGVADYYDREAGYTIRNLTTYLEPLLIFVLAVMVLIMALAIFLPMWNLIRVFRPT